MLENIHQEKLRNKPIKKISQKKEYDRRISCELEKYNQDLDLINTIEFQKTEVMTVDKRNRRKSCYCDECGIQTSKEIQFQFLNVRVREHRKIDLQKLVLKSIGAPHKPQMKFLQNLNYQEKFDKINKLKESLKNENQDENNQYEQKESQNIRKKVWKRSNNKFGTTVNYKNQIYGIKYKKGDMQRKSFSSSKLSSSKNSMLHKQSVSHIGNLFLILEKDQNEKQNQNNFNGYQMIEQGSKKAIDKNTTGSNDTINPIFINQQVVNNDINKNKQDKLNIVYSRKNQQNQKFVKKIKNNDETSSQVAFENSIIYSPTYNYSQQNQQRTQIENTLQTSQQNLSQNRKTKIRNFDQILISHQNSKNKSEKLTDKKKNNYKKIHNKQYTTIFNQVQQQTDKNVLSSNNYLGHNISSQTNRKANNNLKNNQSDQYLQYYTQDNTPKQPLQAFNQYLQNSFSPNDNKNGNIYIYKNLNEIWQSVQSTFKQKYDDEQRIKDKEKKFDLHLNLSKLQRNNDYSNEHNNQRNIQLSQRNLTNISLVSDNQKSVHYFSKQNRYKNPSTNKKIATTVQNNTNCLHFDQNELYNLKKEIQKEISLKNYNISTCSENMGKSKFDTNLAMNQSPRQFNNINLQNNKITKNLITSKIDWTKQYISPSNSNSKITANNRKIQYGSYKAYFDDNSQNSLNKVNLLQLPQTDRAKSEATSQNQIFSQEQSNLVQQELCYLKKFQAYLQSSNHRNKIRYGTIKKNQTLLSNIENGCKDIQKGKK